ncbi:MAG: peptidylprolyl isomerase [Bacteroidales bacterium]|nr:peptidylprolyl isomerase [Bacteroidales bacterium]
MGIKKLKLVFLLLTIFVIPTIYGQKKVVDQLVAIVGDNVILQSDIENQYLQLLAQGYKSTGDIKCEIFDELMVQKLFLNQAELDSITVSEATVELQLDQRLNYFIRQIGSLEKLEAYFNKTKLEIKEDFRDIIREQLITQQVQSSILGNVTVTPSDVRKYFNSLSKDSLPFINSTVQIRQIVFYPPFNEEAIFEVKERLLDLRKRIIDGESFAALAVLYSEDKETSSKGGEKGYMSKAELPNEYAKVAFGLKKGGISKIVTSEMGYHIIQLIDRQDDRINTRHILMKPKLSPEAIEKTLSRLDSISNLIKTDSITFEMAAKYLSRDEDSRLNGGLVINPITGSSRFHMDDFSPQDYYIIKNLKVGEISEPFESKDKNGNTIFKIITLVSQSEPHVANLKEDYNIIQGMAEEHYRQKALEKWIAEKKKTIFIKIDDSFSNCPE